MGAWNGAEMRQVLVVANQTLLGVELAEVIKARMSEVPCEFFLLVPVPPIRARSRSVESSETEVGAGAESHRPDSHELTRQRVEIGLKWMRELGATASGNVGGEDPLGAIRYVIGHRPVDEIVISTLPKGVSRWLRQDLPHRVERRFKLPVTVVTAGTSLSGQR